MSRYTYYIGVGLNPGAIPDYFRALARELTARGHRVAFLTWGARGSARTDKDRREYEVYRWPSPRPTTLRDAFWFWRLTRRERPHCVIGNFGSTNVMMAVGWAAGVPCRVAWYHTLSRPIELDWKNPKWQLRFLRWRKRAIYRLATHIVGNSMAAVNDIKRVYGVREERCSYFFNALLDPAQAGVQRPLRHQYDVSLIVCAGRFYPSKGQDVLLHAMKRVLARVPDVRLRLVGGGPTLAEAKQLAARLGIIDKCEFTGAVPHGEVLRHMAEASVVVVPSRDEAFGLVAIEGLSVGVPVVASRVGGLQEIVRDGQDGFLVTPEEPQELAEALIRVLKDRTLRERLGLGARRRFLEAFEQGKVVREVADWLERIVADALTGRQVETMPRR